MPKLSTIVAQSSARAQVNVASPARMVDFTGVQRAAADVGNTAEQLRVFQEHKAAKLADDEARLAAVNLSSDASVTWTERLQQAKNGAPVGAAGLTESVLKDFDTWKTEKLKALPQAARRYAEDDMARFKAGLHADAFRYEVEARNGKLVTDYGQGADADNKAVFAEPGQFSVITAKRLAVLDGMDLPAATKQKLAADTREKLAYSAASAQAERDPEGLLTRVGVRGAKVGRDGKPSPQDEAKAAEAVRSDPILSSLSPEGLRQVVDRATMISETRKAAAAAEAERRQRQAEMLAERRAREADQAWNVLNGWAMSGKVADDRSPAVQKMIGQLQGTPYAGAFAEMQRQAAAGAAVASKPIAQQQVELDQIKARRNQNGTTPALETEIKHRETILTTQRREFDEDPMRAAVEYRMLGQGGLAPVDVSSVDSMLASVGPRLAQSETVRGKVGKPVSLLTADEAERFGRGLASLPVPQRATALAAIGDRLGPQAAAGLAQQLDKKDKALALALQYGSSRTTAGRYTAELILSGQKALKDKTAKMDPAIETGWRATVAREIGDAYGNERQAEDIKESAMLIAAGMAAEGSVDMKRAVRLAARGEIVDFNGRKVPLPAEMTEGQFEQRVRSIQGSELAKQAPGGKVRVGTQAVPLDDFVKSLPDSQLVYAGNGRYAVMGGNRVVTNEQGAPIFITARP